MDRLRKLLQPTGLKVGLLTTACALAVYAAGIPFFHMMELKAFDLQLLGRGVTAPLGTVAIVAVDEKSLDELGRWPWPRRKVAELSDILARSGARTVAFDMVFSEPENDTGAEEAGPDPGAPTEADSLLAASLSSNPAVILGYFFYLSREEVSHIEPGGVAADAGAAPYVIRRLSPGTADPVLPEAAGVETNLPQLAEAAGDLGYFNTVPDPDGIVRRAPLAIEYGGAAYPHLSVEAVRKYLDAPAPVINVAEYGVESIDVGNLNIPVDERGYLIINYRGPRKTFPHYSFSDVLSGAVPPGTFRDKIVLVGATATGIYDMRAAPFTGTFPGVEIHANIIDTMLRGDFIHRPDWVIIFDIFAIVLPGLILSLLLPRISAVSTAVITLAMALAYILFNTYAFRHLGLWLIEVYPLFTIFFVSGSVMVFQFTSAERKRRQIREAFSHYVSPPLVEEIASNPGKLVLGGEERRLTVLFSDIRGFTTISEGIKNPQALVRLMNSYFTPMTEVILSNGGTIDKYMGDSIMAFWGAPVWQEDHAARACRAALEMRAKLFELKDVWRGMRIRELDIGIGISTGALTVGNMGSMTRFDYTVIGDTVNIGSRLESLNKVYGTHIIVPKYTYEDVKDEFVLRELDFIRVKGKKLPLRIYELMGTSEDREDLAKMVELFEKGLEAYRVQDWDTAEVYFRTVLELAPDDGPSKAFIDRVNTLRTIGVPQAWDGIFIDTERLG